MPIPKQTRSGQTYEITMMELREQPGQVIEAVRAGAHVHITKSGKHVATMVPAAFDPDAMIVINPDGSTDGRKPVTWREPSLLRN